MHNLNALYTFFTVAETGGVTKAAHTLHVTQSAVSHSLRSLEQQFDTPLLHRSRRECTLTEAGQLLFAACQQMFAGYRQAREQIVGLQRGLVGDVTIICHPGIGNLWLAKQLRALAQHHPGLTLHITLREQSDPMLTDLIERRGDLAFYYAVAPPPARPTLHFEEVTRPALVLFASRAYLRRHPPIRTVQDLTAHHFIEYNREDSPYRKILQRLLALPTYPQFAAVHYINSLPAIREAVLAGLGLAYQPCYSIGDDLRRQRIRLVLPNKVRMPIPLYCICRLRDRALPKIVAVKEQLCASLRTFIAHSEHP